MSNRSIALMALTLVATMFATASAMAQEPTDLAAVEVQVLPNNNAIIVNLGDQDLEFCLDERDRGCADGSGNPQDSSCSCRLLQNSCDFIIANKATGEISEPEPITPQAVDLVGGPGALSILKEKSPLLVESFKFGENECNMRAAATVPGDDRTPPFSPPACINCVEPASAGQPQF
jgi:hypothetical protein